jgi:hypothetical protein
MMEKISMFSSLDNLDEGNSTNNNETAHSAGNGTNIGIADESAHNEITIESSSG